MMFVRRHYDAATLRALLAMCLPMIVSQGTFALMIFTHRYFLAHLSPAHMAAAMGGGVAWFFSYSLFNGVLAYANALVAQYLGAVQHGKCSKVLTQGLLLSVACIPFLVVITYFMRQLFAAMGHAPEQVALEQQYYDVLMLASFLTLVKVCFASFFTGTGRTRVVMICELCGIVVNIPLSYVLIFGMGPVPSMGIAGAAWSTIFSSVFTLVAFVCFYLQPLNRRRFAVANSWHFDAGITRRYLRLGLPSGLEMFLNVAAFNLFLLMFHSYGVVEAAAATIVFNWDILSFVPLLGLNIAVVSLTGRAIGAGDVQSTDAIVSAGYLLGLGYSLLLASLFLMLRGPLVEMFIFGEGAEADGIRALALFMMVGLSAYALLEGVLQVATGVLRGAGDTRWVMMTSASLHWGMLVLQFFIIKVFGFGPKLSWLTFVLMILVIVACFIRRLHSSQWRDPQRLRAVMRER